jgi:RNA 2',3'-cyclic 3'-phosphodiesterase
VAERLRLFVALELPGEVRDELVAWRREALAPDPGLRAVERDALHATLCFLGSRPAAEAGAIAAACERGAAGMPGPSLALGAELWLPARRPRVCAVALADPDRALAGLQASLARALVAGGFLREQTRPFLAHVTVARVRRATRPPPVPRGTPDGPRALAFDALAVALMRSHLGAGGARYEAIHRILLGGPAGGR